MSILPGVLKTLPRVRQIKFFKQGFSIPFVGDFLKPSIPILSFLFGWLVPYPITFDVILQIINIFFLTVLIISTPILLRIIECEVSNWSAFLLFIPLAWNYIVINGLIDGAGLFYCYDIPSLAFYVIGLILFLKKSWLWFYIVFITW